MSETTPTPYTDSEWFVEPGATPHITSLNCPSGDICDFYHRTNIRENGNFVYHRKGEAEGVLDGNMRLVVGAVNSYRKHFPGNAVEAAERDEMGSIMESACRLIESIADKGEKMSGPTSICMVLLAERIGRINSEYHERMLDKIPNLFAKAPK